MGMSKQTETPKRSHHARVPAKIPYSSEDSMTSEERRVNHEEFGSYVSPMAGSAIRCSSPMIRSRIRGMALTDFGVNVM
jgi:hypothetical protein